MYEIIVYEIILPVTVFLVRYSASVSFPVVRCLKGGICRHTFLLWEASIQGREQEYPLFSSEKSASAYGYCLPVPAVHSSFFQAGTRGRQLQQPATFRGERGHGRAVPADAVLWRGFCRERVCSL